MLDYISAGMILIGILSAAFTGHMADVTNGAISSAREAVSTALTMLGVISLWTGLMKIGEKAGIVSSMCRKITPFLSRLFPSVPKESKAMEYIGINVIANFLGLGWASTPAGLKAMEELQKYNPHKEKATTAMCGFMIFNMSSLQLVSVNLIAYRTQYNSQAPSEIIGPGIATTLVSTITAIIFLKIMEKYNK